MTDRAREREFFEKLTALLTEYPEVTAQIRPSEPEGFDDAAPKIIDGIALIVSQTNVQGWHECMWVGPPDQHPYLTRGLIYQMANRL